MTSEAQQQRRAALLGVQLGALVRDHAGEAPVVLGSFGGGAALLRDATAWVLADDQPVRALGRALAWGRQQGATVVNVVTTDDAAAGVLARRAAYFADPPQVFVADGRLLRPAAPAPLEPEAAVPPAVLGLVPVIEAAGAVPMVEHGVLVGEVAGLEVCRATLDPTTGAARLEVGVGVHDREAFALVHGDIPTVEALAGVVASVARYRRVDAPTHPLNRLGAERLLRWRLIEDPALVDAAVLAAASPAVPRGSVKDVVPCVAAGIDDDGRPIVVVCSVGIDLDLVPFAADARRATGPADARLVLAVPRRDAHPVTLALAARLLQPATVVSL